MRSSFVRNALSPVLASSITRTLGTAPGTASNAFATSVSCPVIVCPAGSVTDARYGDVFPPLPNAWLILCAVCEPGWPGSEKSTVNRLVVLPASAIPATRMTPHTATTHRRCRRMNSAHCRITPPT